jgi:putative peptidoglycan lipid II flippase
VSTALLPALSRQLAAGDDAAAASSQNRGLEFALLLTLPAAAALLVIALPIVTMLFERGAFGPTETRATADALMAYATGLPAYVLIRVLTPGFFAREDTSTPVRIAAAVMVLNIVLNLILMQVWGHVGIALASSVAAWANATALAVVLKRRGQLTIDDRLADRGPKIALASAGMTVGLFAGERLVVPACAGPCAANIPSLAVLIIGSMVLYGGLAHILGAARWSDLKALRWRGGEEVGGSLTTPK